MRLESSNIGITALIIRRKVSQKAMRPGQEKRRCRGSSFPRHRGHIDQHVEVPLGEIYRLWEAEEVGR